MKRYSTALIVLALVLTVALLGTMSNMQPTQAAPALQAQNPLLIFASSKVVTEGTFYGDTNDVGQYNTSEAQYTIDQNGVNTTTLYLQKSNDRQTWTDVTLVSANIADANGWLTPALDGKFNRLKITTANSLPVTVTFNLLAKAGETPVNNVVANVTVLTVTTP